MLSILLIKTSSLGDVIHALPVVKDLLAYDSDVQIDWIVEKDLSEILDLTSKLRRVIPLRIRYWRRNLWSSRDEIRLFKSELQSRNYDFVIDMQGLLKSALVTWCAKGVRCGLNWRSSREPLRFFYDRTFEVPWSLHAIERNRSLVAQALGYQVRGEPEYGVAASPHKPTWLSANVYCVLFHGTSGQHKLWPDASWVALGNFLSRQGLACILPWGSEAERNRSVTLSRQIPNAIIPERMGLNEIAALLAGAKVVIGVDTGLAHLSAALHVPTVGIYCATSPDRTGLRSPSAVNLGDIGKPPSTQEVIATVERTLANG